MFQTEWDLQEKGREYKINLVAVTMLGESITKRVVKFCWQFAPNVQKDAFQTSTVNPLFRF